MSADIFATTNRRIAAVRAERERCAAVADAEYEEQARLATFHHGEGNVEAMDRRNAAAVSASRIAAAIRNP